MAVGTRRRVGVEPELEGQRVPEVSVCESCPGTSVFLEAGNTDGWIASDTTVDVEE